MKTLKILFAVVVVLLLSAILAVQIELLDRVNRMKRNTFSVEVENTPSVEIENTPLSVEINDVDPIITSPLPVQIQR